MNNIIEVHLINNINWIKYRNKGEQHHRGGTNLLSRFRR